MSSTWTIKHAVGASIMLAGAVVLGVGLNVQNKIPQQPAEPIAVEKCEIYSQNFLSFMGEIDRGSRPYLAAHRVPVQFLDEDELGYIIDNRRKKQSILCSPAVRSAQQDYLRAVGEHELQHHSTQKLAYGVALAGGALMMGGLLLVRSRSR